VSDVGMMVDFLKNNPYVTLDDYMWKLNPCLIKLMTIDNTRVHYLTDKERERKKTKVFDGTKSLTNDLGIPIFGKDGKMNKKI
jgi:hypothetical protein